METSAECSDADIAAAISSVVERFSLAGRSLVVLVPDGTRSAPMARIAAVAESVLAPVEARGGEAPWSPRPESG